MGCPGGTRLRLYPKRKPHCPLGESSLANTSEPQIHVSLSRSSRAWFPHQCESSLPHLEADFCFFHSQSACLWGHKWSTFISCKILLQVLARITFGSPANSKTGAVDAPAQIWLVILTEPYSCASIDMALWVFWKPLTPALSLEDSLGWAWDLPVTLICVD